MPYPLRERSCALAGNIDKSRIISDFIQHRQSTLRLWQQLVIQIALELQQGIVDAQPVITHAASEEHDVFLLARQSFKDLKQLRSRRVHRVIEFHFVNFPALFPAKRFLAQIGNFPVNVQILSLEIIQLSRQVEHVGPKSCADVKRRWSRIFVELANVVRRGTRVLRHNDFDKFRRTGLKDAAERELSGIRRLGRWGDRGVEKVTGKAFVDEVRNAAFDKNALDKNSIIARAPPRKMKTDLRK